MKTKCIALFIVAIGAEFLYASPAATQSWVTNKISAALSSSIPKTQINSYGTVMTAGGITFTVENPSVKSLMATNVTNLAVEHSVTNGKYYVWNDVIHGYTNHSDVILSTRTNLIWNSVQSHGNSFSNYFDVVGRMIQPVFAKEVTK